MPKRRVLKKRNSEQVLEVKQYLQEQQACKFPWCSNAGLPDPVETARMMQGNLEALNKPIVV